MSSHADFDEDASGRTYTAPYTSHHPIPTIQGYEGKREDRDQSSDPANPEDHDPPDASKKLDFIAAAKDRLFSSHAKPTDVPTNQQPYESYNRHLAEDGKSKGQGEDMSLASTHEISSEDVAGDEDPGSLNDTSETIPTSNDPRQKRKIMKKINRDHRGREVTDPVTHLPVTIHDATNTELNAVPENEVSADHAAGIKNDNHGQHETGSQQASHRGMKSLFPPPSLEAFGENLISIVSTAVTAGLGSLLGILLLSLLTSLVYHGRVVSDGDPDQTRSTTLLLVTFAIFLVIEAIVSILIILGIRFWVRKRVTAIWEDGIWDAAQTREQEGSETSLPESVQWLNSLLASVWPLINPDLFTSLADTLEDVMQASLPKLVRMISVEDLGQGNEAIRILGVKWLPTGNAKKGVSVSGQLQESSPTQESDRKVSSEGVMSTKTEPHDAEGNASNHHAEDKELTSDGPGEDQAIAKGLEAEEGDFVNVEIGFSYRASNTGKSMKVKAKNAHLYLLFYLPGGMRFRKLLERP